MHTINMMDEKESIVSTKNITLKDAIVFMRHARDEVSSETISNCWLHSD
jgi:hypothetical protein